MNVFVLSTGRCGSTTFIAACRHISNYTAAHESRLTLTGPERFAYPDDHIEADNRLSWFLGRLDRSYGPKALYVHLTRNRDATAASFVKREQFGIMKAYRDGILLGAEPGLPAEELAHDYIETVESNILLFLKDKPNQLSVRLEAAESDFASFWERIGAKGDLRSALDEWKTAYNASVEQL